MCLGQPDIPDPKPIKPAKLPAQRVQREAPQRVDPEVIRKRMSRMSAARETVQRSRAIDNSPGVLETTQMGLKEDI